MDNDEVIKSLKRMESLLEAIDWKLWTFHQKFMKQESSPLTESNQDLELDSVMSDSKSDQKAKFPTVEKWS